jgi:hypothetical protein
MAEKLDPKETVTIEELVISHMWEMAALLEVLERKGLITKQEVLDAVQELRRKTPNAQARQEPFPEPYLSTENTDALIAHLFDVFNATGLTAHQAKDLLAVQ